MKKITLIALLIISSVFIYSCSDKKAEPEAKPQPTPEITDATSKIPDEFVYPGEIGSTEKPSSDTETANQLVEYIQDFTDMSKYGEPYVSTQDGYIIYYTIKEEYSAEKDFDYSFVIGSEKSEITLPETAPALIDRGFTIFGDTTPDTEIPPHSESVFTVCTPESGEIIGFNARNTTVSTKKLSELTLNSVTLLSINNFTAFNAVNGKSDIKDIIKALGEPDIINISSAEGECSVVLEYSDPQKGYSVFALADGKTKELIALSIIES